MDKSEFIKQASIQIMATESVAQALLVTQGLVPSKQEVTINGVVDSAERLWQELKKRGYAKEYVSNYEPGDSYFDEEYS